MPLATTSRAVFVFYLLNFIKRVRNSIDYLFNAKCNAHAHGERWTDENWGQGAREMSNFHPRPGIRATPVVVRSRARISHRSRTRFEQ